MVTGEVALQVDQQNVEAVHHRIGRPAHLPVQAEHRDAVQRVLEIRRFDHVVLLVAAQPVLRPEGGGEVAEFLGRQFLVLEHDDEMAVEGLADASDQFRRRRTGETRAVEHRARGAVERLAVEYPGDTATGAVTQDETVLDAFLAT